MATMKTREDTEKRSVAEQAADWLLILEDAGPEEHEAFADWLARSPVHVGAFLRASAVDRLAEGIDPEHDLEIPQGPFSDTPIGAATDAQITQTPLRRNGFFREKRWAMAAGIAFAMAGLLLAAAWQRTGLGEWKHLAAAVGEQRVLELEDGSVLYLEPGSSVDLRFTGTERALQLLTGGAMFQVAHDTQRPFRVHAGNAIVQAVGTQFSVSRLREDAVVSVVEGIVQVSRETSLLEKLIRQPDAAGAVLRLGAGQETRVAHDGLIAAARVATADPVKNWKERRLTFLNEPLSAIADEFNRYNRTPKIRIVDAAAGELRFAAAFDAGDMDSLVLVLEGNPKLHVERGETEIVIRSR